MTTLGELVHEFENDVREGHGEDHLPHWFVELTRECRRRELVAAIRHVVPLYSDFFVEALADLYEKIEGRLNGR